MTKLIAKITTIRNWIGKLLLWVLGAIMIVGQNYGYILESFLLTDRTFPEPTLKYYVISGAGLVFWIGGWRLNALVDKFLNLKKYEDAGSND